VLTETGEPHFLTVESIGDGVARLLDGGRVRAVETGLLERIATGRFLTVDADAARTAPRVHCPNTVVMPSRLPEREKQETLYFPISNTGDGTLRLTLLHAQPQDGVHVVCPFKVDPHSTGRVAVALDGTARGHSTWTVLVGTNDPLRPVLWLGGESSPAETKSVLSDASAELTRFAGSYLLASDQPNQR